MTGVFTGKHLGTLAVVAVVAHALAEEPLLVAIVVLIDKVGLLCLHRLPTIGKAIGVAIFVFGHRTTRAYNLDIGILGADGCYEGLQALVVELAPLLIAYTDILHVEGRRMAHLGTYLSPLRVGRSVGKLDEVEAVVDVRLQLVEGYMGALLVPVLELAGEADAEDGQGLGTDILGKLEELEEAEAVRLIVVGEVAIVEGVLPAILVERTILYRANGILPLIARLQVGTFNDATTGKAEYTRMKVF